MIEFLPIELVVPGATLVPSSCSPSVHPRRNRERRGAHVLFLPYRVLCRIACAALEFSRFSSEIA